MFKKSLIFVLVFLLALAVPVSAAANYTYSKVTASNGVVLHAMKASPNDIKLKAISSNLKNQSSYGINGGFFGSGGTLLSIAVNNHVPAGGGSIGELYKGAVNVGYARGTLVWDAKASKYSVQVVKWASELNVSNTSNYWAQGGISMRLSSDSTWKSQATAENIPGGVNGTASGRSALVYNSGGNIWLVVTNTTCTPEQFRTAIKEKIGSGTLVDGIFLDGSGSSQMKAQTSTGQIVDVTGDGRTVYQMVTFK
ncbi:hypothetical protein [Paenibacillus elgii]|uniref:hypothetical protein n=1 Tax=Paenibacillus elgii TaxID=189691 RepID=UPI0013D3C2C9|nr:hypothetical protein [Paenibacillus elgii]